MARLVADRARLGLFSAAVVVVIFKTNAPDVPEGFGRESA
jgi:hypothetical protein